jgi:rhamnulokinase
MRVHHFLAFDLGAESGRTILGKLEDERISTRELTRFPNGPVRVLGHLHWNIYNLFEEIKKGIKACLEDAAIRPEALAIDTWGVDFGFLARDGSILGLPLAYRDARTKGAMEGFMERLPREKIYEMTGIQFLPFNTLFQLYALAREKSPLLEHIAGLLFMPDLFNYLLTGEKVSEFTMASTSQLLDPRRGTWNEELFAALEIDPAIMQDVLLPGTSLGALSPPVSQEIGLDETLVIATASHDTAAAIAAIPASGTNWAYISSGTWSLMGVEVAGPIINAKALASNFTNEGGVSGTIRFLKNIAGLWLLQQCRKEWAKTATLTYEELTRLAADAPPFKSFVDPDWPGFLNPPSMPGAIRQFCLKTGQKPPLSVAEFVRCILESLALKYRLTLDRLRQLTETQLDRIHVIGGGSQNQLLCQMSADATGVPIVAGPAEATSTGNIMVQALALGYVQSLDDIRKIIRNSVELRNYEPSGVQEWDLALERYQNLLNNSQKKR